MNTLNAPYLLTDDEARDLQNVQGTTAGAIVKRSGLVTFASPANVFNSLYALESISPIVLVGADASALYSVSTAGTVTSIKTGLSNDRWSFTSAPVVSAQGPLYAVNGVDPPQQWSGTGLAGAWTKAVGTAVDVPNGKYMLFNQNQVFISGVTANPSRLYWSAIADPTNWDPASLTGAGSMDFDPNDGEQITGIGVVGPYVLVGKPRKLWVLVNPATATARKLSDNIGVAAHRSIASGPEGTYFLAEDRGVYVTNGTKLTPISDKIQPTIDGMIGLRSLAAGVYFNAHYYLSVPLMTNGNDTLLDYDSKLGSWWKHTIGSNQFVLWHPTPGVAQLYSAKATSPIVDQCFAPSTFQDNGADFTWVWRGPWQSPTFYRRRRFPTPYFRKRWRQVRLDGTGTVDFSVARDFSVAETLVRRDVFNYATGSDTFGVTGTWAGAGTFGGQATVSKARVLAGLGVANAMSFVFSATSNTQDELLSYVMMLTDRRDSVVA